MLVVHHCEFQLQGVVLAVCVVYEYVFLGDAVFAQFHNLKAEAFLHQAVFVVLAEEQGLAVAHVDGVLGAAFLLVNGVVAAVVEDYAVLQNLAYRCALVLVGSLQYVDCSFCVSGYGACKEVASCAEAKLGGQERVFHCAVR